jgi:AcrR family transcriptional regulator
VRAVARHGLAKLAMSDVSQSAGVSRGTLYRYFPTREVLLDALAQREAERLFRRVIDATQAAPAGEAQLRVLLELATREVRAHPALQRLLESDPAEVLEGIRRRLPEIVAAFHQSFGPALAETELVRGGAVTSHQLVDWMTRFLISMYLFEDPEPEQTLRGLTAMYRLLAEPRSPAP